MKACDFFMVMMEKRGDGKEEIEREQLLPPMFSRERREGYLQDNPWKGFHIMIQNWLISKKHKECIIAKATTTITTSPPN
jgi:hypothetical protein